MTRDHSLLRKSQVRGAASTEGTGAKASALNPGGRFRRVAESGTVAISRLVAEMKADGREVLDLGAGVPGWGSTPSAIDAAVEALRDGRTTYTAVPGLPELRERLAALNRERFGAPWTRDDVIVTCGAKAALFQIAQVLPTSRDLGDEPRSQVVVPTPAWVSFAAQLSWAGLDVVEVPTDPADGWALRAEPILERIGRRTRAVVLCSPCNPTGAVVGRDDLHRIVEACAKQNVLVVSDETYQDFGWDGPNPTVASLATDFRDTVVQVGSFSKIHAMTGWRMGYAFGPRDLVEALSALQTHTTGNPTTFAMWGALAALDEDPAPELRERLRPLIRDCSDRLAGVEGVHCPRPRGGFYLFVQLPGPPPGGRGTWAAHLLERTAVAVVPGEVFGAPDAIRICLAGDPTRVRTGVGRVVDRLRRDLADRSGS